MAQPRDLRSFDPPPQGGRSWRVAHLSDIHAVGERYGFRIESGRSGPRGNGRLRQVLARLDAIHEKQPLDAILITGDLTDAGRSAEWAEFFDALAPYPRLAGLLIGLPGNHDVNVVDRANPARLDLPASPRNVCVKSGPSRLSPRYRAAGSGYSTARRPARGHAGTSPCSHILAKSPPSRIGDPSVCRGAWRPCGR